MQITRAAWSRYGCDRVTTVDLLSLYPHVLNTCYEQRLDTNEVEVNVDLITGRAFRQTTDMIHQTLPDVVLSLKNQNASTTANPTK